MSKSDVMEITLEQLIMSIAYDHLIDKFVILLFKEVPILVQTVQG